MQTVINNCWRQLRIMNLHLIYTWQNSFYKVNSLNPPQTGDFHYAVSSILALVLTSLGRKSYITGEKVQETLWFLCLCLAHCQSCAACCCQIEMCNSANRDVTMHQREKSALFKPYCQFRPPWTTKRIILKVVKGKKNHPPSVSNKQMLPQLALRTMFCVRVWSPEHFVLYGCWNIKEDNDNSV